MAVKLGYGGIANTNGARDFSGKEASVGTTFSGGATFLLLGVGTCWAGVLVLALAVLGGR